VDGMDAAIDGMDAAIDGMDAAIDECTGIHTVGKAGESCVAAGTSCAICESGLVCDATRSPNGLFGTCVPPCSDGGTPSASMCCTIVDFDNGWCIQE
jgi:hypothetical protein